MNGKSLFKQNIFNIVGIIVGVIAIISGFVVMGQTWYIGSYAEFGADFYTYIYNATKMSGEAINEIIVAMGGLTVFIGLIGVCFFANNIVKSKQRRDKDDIMYHLVKRQSEAIINELKSIEMNQKNKIEKNEEI